VTGEQERLVSIAHTIYGQYPYDGKYILDGENLVICQSNAISDTLRFQYPGAAVNPLGHERLNTTIISVPRIGICRENREAQN
jgi:S-adenosylmethionine synthetase